MSLSSIIDIASMGMSAQSVRLNTTASNLANAEAASSNTDEVYRARHPVFETMRMNALLNGFESVSGMEDEASMGPRVVDIVESQQPLQRRYEPNHPKADAEGYVFYPNVNVVEEMADMISASRSFQVNVELMNSAKSMIQQVLSLGR